MMDFLSLTTCLESRIISNHYIIQYIKQILSFIEVHQIEEKVEPW